MKIELEYPITIKDENGNTQSISEITLSRMKGKHLKLMPDSFFKNGGKNIKPHEIIPLIAGLANIPLESGEEIDLEDLTEIGGKLNDFLSKSLPTGKK